MPDGKIYASTRRLIMANEEKKYLTQEEALLKAKELLGEKAEKALRDHLGEIGEDFYHWMADLYVPRKCNCNNFDSEGNRICLIPRDENGKCKCTGGGFYYSNSARDNDGYDIDIESTVQAIRFLQSTGMIHKYSNNLRLALPAQMQKDIDFIVSFVDQMANAAFCPVSKDIPQKMKDKLDVYMNRKRDEG